MIKYVGVKEEIKIPRSEYVCNVFLPVNKYAISVPNFNSGAF